MCENQLSKQLSDKLSEQLSQLSEQLSNKLSEQSSKQSSEQVKNKFCIVIEGLDGIGKSTIVNYLAENLNAKLIATPPDIIKPFRSIFIEDNNTDIRFTYYMVGNFIAGEEVKRILLDEQNQSVIMDRFYASTIAYIMGKSDDELPTIGSDVYSWPKDLFKPEYMFVLTMDETDRIERLINRSIKQNNQLSKEDMQIKSNPFISERINQIYRNIGCIEIKVNKTDTTEMICDKIKEYITIY